MTLISELAAEILGMDYRIAVVVDGKDASGKTTFADRLATTLGEVTDREVIRVSLDDFFQPRAIRKRNQDQARGCYDDTFDISAIIAQLLEPYRRGDRFAVKVFDYVSDRIDSVWHAAPHEDAILVVDGVYAQRPELRYFWDLVILLEVDDAVVEERGVRRDIERIGSYEEAVERYENRYIAAQKLYYEECNPVATAGIVIDNTDYDRPVRLN